jgi:cyclic-di-GMP-binding protein
MNTVLPRPHPAIDYAQPSQCLAALHALNTTATDDAQRTLSGLLHGMANHPPPPGEHLHILEEMRPTLDFVLAHASQRYASRALPPSSGEENTLEQTVALWQDMARNYGVVFERSLADPAFRERRALLAQRHIQYTAQAMVEYFRARREMAPDLWRLLHGRFLEAERGGVADVRVPDPLNETWGAQSAQEAYVAMLLIDAAGPYSRSPREFTWLVRWAHRFAPYCLLRPITEGDAAHALYALDPAADHGLRPWVQLAPAVGLRGLDTQKLAAHIHAVVGQLKKGVAAASLGLGEDCVQPACARLLVSLYRPWGMASAGRKFPRRRHHGLVRICTDLQGVAFFLEGHEFVQPNDPRRTSFSQTQVFRVFGARAEGNVNSEELQQRALQLGFVQEGWDVLDQSVAGYRLTREAGESRIEHRQLVGLHPGNGEGMLLAEISWMQYMRNGTLQAGTNVLPGPPQVAAVKLHLNERSVRERYRLGFMVPAVPSMKTEMTLIVPAGWFMADRIVEVQHGDTPWFARMDKLVSRGSNFDRVSFTRQAR